VKIIDDEDYATCLKCRKCFDDDEGLYCSDPHYAACILETEGDPEKRRSACGSKRNGGEI